MGELMEEDAMLLRTREARPASLYIWDDNILPASNQTGKPQGWFPPKILQAAMPLSGS